MASKNSFTTLAEQIIAYNTNLIKTLNTLSDLIDPNKSNVSINIPSSNVAGTRIAANSVNAPSLSFLSSEIERLNRNINSMYSINEAGALIQESSANKFKKVVTIDLNREPSRITGLTPLTNFVTTRNWIFDGLLNPMMNVEIDLSGKVQDNVRKVLVRRYIVSFAKDTSGNISVAGQTALNSFNTLFRGKSNINLDEFELWHQTTAGVVDPLTPNIDEQVFDLDPNQLQYDGTFNVLKIEEDTLNRKIWYHLNKLEYVDLTTNGDVRMKVGDEFIINSEISNTRYKVVEISTIDTNPKIRVERTQGNQPIPTGIGVIKIYSPVLYSKKVKVSIGYDERNVVFVKAMNADNHLVARNWSTGIGYWTNDLRLISSDNDNGKTLEQFYIEKVYDYGKVLEDLVAKKIPNDLAGVPVAPTLSADNFKVVQINKHLTDTPDSNLIKTKHNQQKNLKSEIQQLTEAIESKSKALKTTKFSTESEKKQHNNDIVQLQKKKDSKNKLYQTVINDILSLSNTINLNVDAKFKVRGFWAIPDPIITRGSRPQEVVQFKVQYRYLSKDGKENPVETFKVAKTNGKTQNAAFSNWTEYLTDARKRVRNESTGEWTWEIQNVSDADTPNINQLDISIQKGEKVEIRVKSLSEVGWPESPVESDWSETLTIEFPDSLNNVVAENDFILKEASQEEVKVRMETELSAKGLDEHLSDMIIANDKVTHHVASKIASGFKDENGVSLDLFEYLQKMELRVKSLEEKIARVKGELQVVIYKNNQEYVVSNGSTVTFNVECESYMTKYTGDGIPTGRVYENGIYVIRDYVIKIKNVSASAPLGLLSGRLYETPDEKYSPSAPQCFWVNDRDELITETVNGKTKTQVNNQIIWSVNYERSSSDNTVKKVSENIGNKFTTNNSLVPALSKTEFNIGYSEITKLSFAGSDNSILDPSKWVEVNTSVSSTTKLLTTIHPVVSDLDIITEGNADKVRTINPGRNNDITIPLNIYFKPNSLSTSNVGANYQYVNYNNLTKTVKHIKVVSFLLENEADNKPFKFTVKFNINRNMAIIDNAYVANNNVQQ